MFGNENMGAQVTRPDGGLVPVHMKILIADDYAIVRLGVRRIVLDAFPNAVIGDAADGQAVLEAVHAGPWDLLILDVAMPGRSGLDILPELRALAPKLPILALSNHDEKPFALRMLQGGAAGYITKERASDELVLAIRRVLAGGRYVSLALAERIAISMDRSLTRLPHEKLSPREFQVIRLLGDGKTVAEISQALSLDLRTIGTFRRHILRKLQLKSTQAIVYYAIRAGLVDWPGSA
jgi:two-component system, NarL family, invasion response regulator UvrY